MQSGIRQKLNEFIHTHYRQRLIRGAMTAGALGLVVFGSGFLLEHYLWLGSVDRAVLFWAMWLLFLPLVAFGVMKPLLHMHVALIHHVHCITKVESVETGWEVIH